MCGSALNKYFGKDGEVACYVWVWKIPCLTAGDFVFVTKKIKG
jgi:hypothetical protein